MFAIQSLAIEGYFEFVRQVKQLVYWYNAPAFNKKLDL